MRERLRAPAARCAWAAVGVMAVSVTIRAGAGEAVTPSPGLGAKTPRALCHVKIVDIDGLPLAPMGLVAFDDGVYRLRTEDGREIKIPDKELSSVTFVPVPDPRRNDKNGDVPADRRGPPKDSREDGDFRPPGHDGRGGPLARRKDEFDRLNRLKRAGELGREIETLKARLRKASNSLEAAMLVRRIVAAKSVEDGTVPTDKDIRALLAIIERADIRERLKNVPLQQFGGPRAWPR